MSIAIQRETQKCHTVRTQPRIFFWMGASSGLLSSSGSGFLLLVAFWKDNRTEPSWLTGEYGKIRPWGLKAEVLWWYSHDWKCSRGNPTKHWGHMKAFFWPVTPSSREKFWPADDGCLPVRWTKMDCRVYCSLLYMRNMTLAPKHGDFLTRSSVNEHICGWLITCPDPSNSIYLEMVTSFPSLTFFTNVIAQTSAKAQRTWLSAVWKHICAHVYVYLDSRWYGSTGRSKVQLAIIFGLYSFQADLQDASQRLISWLFFVSQGVHLLYELLDLI